MPATLDDILAVLNQLLAIQQNAKPVQHLTFVATLTLAGTATSGAKVAIQAPFTGTIREVDVAVLQGPNGLVGVSCSHSNQAFLPRAEDAPYLYLNNVYAPFYPREHVKGGEQIVVDMNNGDGVNPHTVTVVMRVESD